MMIIIFLLKHMYTTFAAFMLTE